MKLSGIHLLGIFVASTIAAFVVLNWDNIVQREVNQVYDQVTAEQIAQYEMVTRNGQALDRCVHAGLVAAAMLQAKNEPGLRALEAD